MVSPASTSTRASSTITAVTLKSASRSTFGSRRRAWRSGTGSRSSIASSSRARSERWSSSVGSVSSTYRFWTAGRRMTCRPTPTVAALGRVTRGGTTTSWSRVAWTRHASRQPVSSSPGLNVRASCRVTGVAGETRTLHLWHVPWPPHVESMAMPFHDAESKTLTPGGTRTWRWVGGASLSSTVNDSWTRPVPSWAAGSAPDGVISPSRRISSSEKGCSSSGVEVILRRPAPLPDGPGARRSRPCPSRRG